MKSGMRYGLLGLLLMATSVLALSGCGQKGNLYLPDETEQQEDKN